MTVLFLLLLHPPLKTLLSSKVSKSDSKINGEKNIICLLHKLRRKRGKFASKVFNDDESTITQKRKKLNIPLKRLKPKVNR